MGKGSQFDTSYFFLLKINVVRTFHSLLCKCVRGSRDTGRKHYSIQCMMTISYGIFSFFATLNFLELLHNGCCATHGLINPCCLMIKPTIAKLVSNYDK